MVKHVLGIKIDDVTMAEAVSQVEEWLKGEKKRYIVTPNPEMLVLAQKDERFRKILNDADLSIPDGTGLKLSGKVKNTVTGTDLMEKLIGLAVERGYTIGFLGGGKGVAEKCGECLRLRYPKLKISFAEDGGKVDEDGFLLRLSEAHGEVHNGSSPLRLASSSTSRSGSNKNFPPTDLLFVAFGHGKQEKWIAENLDKIPVKVAMGVGGAFDYIAGIAPRAPKWLRDLGGEWLFRLLTQPWRIQRQLALAKYLWLLMRSS